MIAEIRIKEALKILTDLGLPRAQLNDRTAYCLLAMLDLSPSKSWKDIAAPLMGITPIMDWTNLHYKIKYAPNTRETFRRQSMHQFIEAGIVLYNPDKPARPVNSPHAVYQIEPSLLAILKQYESPSFRKNLDAYLSTRETLVKKYANERNMNLIPIILKDGEEIKLSAGAHSELIKAICDEFAARFIPNGDLIYVGDTGDKYGYFNAELLKSLGVELDQHGKMPDVVIYYRDKNWLILIESVTSHGPVDHKRHNELNKLFSSSKAGLVFVSAFPNRKIFLKYIAAISWETEVWIADAPSHMIHFNGERFLGPYDIK